MTHRQVHVVQTTPRWPESCGITPACASLRRSFFAPQYIEKTVTDEKITRLFSLDLPGAPITYYFSVSPRHRMAYDDGIAASQTDQRPENAHHRRATR
jgi:hypothetical protein